MAKISEAFVDITANTRGLQRGLAGAVKSAKIAAGAIAALFAAGKLRQGIESSIRAFLKQEEASQRLASTMRIVGNATQENIRWFQMQADAIQRTTTLADDYVENLFAQAKQYGIANDEIVDVTKATIGLARGLGVSERAILRAMAAARQGDTEMIRRYLPHLRSITDSQEILTRAMAEGARAFEVFEEQAGTLGGEIKQTANVFSDLKEAFGALIASTIEGGKGFALLRSIMRGIEQQAISLTRVMKDLNLVMLANPLFMVIGLVGHIVTKLQEVEDGWVNMTKAMEYNFRVMILRVKLLLAGLGLFFRDLVTKMLGEINKVIRELGEFLALRGLMATSNALKEQFKSIQKIIREMNKETDQARDALGLEFLEELKRIQEEIFGKGAAPKGGGGGGGGIAATSAATVQTVIGGFKVGFNALPQIEKNTAETADNTKLTADNSQTALALLRSINTNDLSGAFQAG
jgi:hypothetical protein